MIPIFWTTGIFEILSKNACKNTEIYEIPDKNLKYCIGIFEISDKNLIFHKISGKSVKFLISL